MSWFATRGARSPLRLCGRIPRRQGSGALVVKAVNAISVRCSVYGDVVGVYEPAAVLADGSLRLTSLAGEPQLEETQALLVHADCGHPCPAGEERGSGGQLS